MRFFCSVGFILGACERSSSLFCAGGFGVCERNFRKCESFFSGDCVFYVFA